MAAGKARNLALPLVFERGRTDHQHFRELLHTEPRPLYLLQMLQDPQFQLKLLQLQMQRML